MYFIIVRFLLWLIIELDTTINLRSINCNKKKENIY